MNYHFCARTDPGRARENNEDSVAIDGVTRTVVLADGMGGYNAGEVASGMATAFIKSELSRWLLEAGAGANIREVRRAMEICVDNANLSIFNAASSNAQYSSAFLPVTNCCWGTSAIRAVTVGVRVCWSKLPKTTRSCRSKWMPV